MSFPKIKLTYFNAAGRAESLRLALHIAGIPFVDNRISFEEFPVLKDSLPTRQVPALEVDGEVYAQSVAQLKFIGRIGGLYPVNDPEAAAHVTEVLGATNDLTEQLVPSFMEQDPEKKKKLVQALLENVMPVKLPQLNARLKQMQQLRVFSSGKIFVHDLQLYTLTSQIKSGALPGVPTTIFDQYESIQHVMDKVSTHPKVVEWNSVKHGTTPSLKLTYFDIPGRAESIRLAFAIGGIAFEDHRVSETEFAELKDKLPYGQVPVLEMDGKVIAQSMAVLDYAGKLSGLYPENDPVLQMRVDEVSMLLEDFSADFMIKKLPVLDATKNRLTQLDARIGHWSSKYAAGDVMTTTDLTIFGLIKHVTSGWYPEIPKDIHHSYKNIMKVFKQVEEHPKVVEWYQKKQ